MNLVLTYVINEVWGTPGFEELCRSMPCFARSCPRSVFSRCFCRTSQRIRRREGATKQGQREAGAAALELVPLLLEGRGNIKSNANKWGVMSTNVVNLDALIPRDDFAVDETPSKATPLDRINMAHLDGHFFAGDLRKPDLQRETAQWTPAKVGDLIRSFLDADLIPAIIL
jgi:hypothetical protein